MREADMSPEAIDWRLRRLSEIRDETKRNQKPVDMSPEAVTRRLVRMSQLRALCLSLRSINQCPVSSDQ